MLVNVKNNQKSAQATLSPFAKKWQQIEKKQKRNANKEKKINDLYNLFQEDILPEDQFVTELLAKETCHLMTFIQRKSFSKYQREELHSWIEENLEALSEHPFAADGLFESTAKQYSDALAEHAKSGYEDVDISPEEIDQMREMANEMFNGDKTFTDDELEGFMRDPSIFQQAFKEYMQSLEDEDHDGANFNDDSDEGFFDGDEDFEQHSQGHSQSSYEENRENQKKQKLKSLFNSSKLNKIYKILANKLHPDKEKNEHLKAEKSELMAALVTAKKNKDAFTLISMFQQFIPESENDFFDGNDEELTEALILLLNEKLHQLDSEHSEIEFSNGVKNIVWRKFNGRSKKQTQENIAMHLANLENSKHRHHYYIEEITTVKQLKEELSERCEERQFHQFDEIPDFLRDLEGFFK